MSSTDRIRQDEREFLAIIYGKIRKNLKGWLRKGAIDFSTGDGKTIRIPIDEITIPTFHFAPPPKDADVSEPGEGDEDDPNTGPDVGLGQGPQQPGDILGPVKPQPGEGDGDGEDADKDAGTGKGETIIEVEIPVDDIAELLQEILELPRIEPKGHKDIPSEERKWTDVRRTGTLLNKRRTMREALKRSMLEGTYDPDRPRYIVFNEDRRFRQPNTITKPQHNAVIFFMMDVSGSMGREERRLVRFFCALVEFWLSYNYEGIEVVWIVHDGEADEVTREEFFGTTRGGGTVISTAHELMVEIINDRFPPVEWNIYPFYLSDGFNWGDDDDKCVELLKEKVLPHVNQYSYIEVGVQRAWWPSSFGDEDDSDIDMGQFSPAGSYGRTLKRVFREEEEIFEVALALLHTMEQVPDAIKEIFKQGN